MSGYSRTESRPKQITPKMTSTRVMTVASTGRLMEVSDSFTRHLALKVKVKR
jgi:hypothetical protein